MKALPRCDLGAEGCHSTCNLDLILCRPSDSCARGGITREVRPRRARFDGVNHGLSVLGIPFWEDEDYLAIAGHISCDCQLQSQVGIDAHRGVRSCETTPRGWKHFWLKGDGSKACVNRCTSREGLNLNVGHGLGRESVLDIIDLHN